MNSLTIYLHEEDYQKVKSIVKERRMTVAQWYRELTRLGISKHELKKLSEFKFDFPGFSESF